MKTTEIDAYISLTLKIEDPTNCIRLHPTLMLPTQFLMEKSKQSIKFSNKSIIFLMGTSKFRLLFQFVAHTHTHKNAYTLENFHSFQGKPNLKTFVFKLPY